MPTNGRRQDDEDWQDQACLFSYKEKGLLHRGWGPSRPSAASPKRRRAWTGGGDAAPSGVRTENSDTLFSQSGNCIRCERGLSAFDNRQRLVVSGLYDLPAGKGRRMDIKNRFLDGVLGGWQLGSIITWRSGFPINPTDGVNRANTNIGVDRRMRPALASLSPIRRRRNGLTPPHLRCSRFIRSATQAGTQSSGQTVFTGTSPRTRISVYRNESHQLQFRWEAFNVLNHPGVGPSECDPHQPDVRSNYLNE